MRRSDVLAAAIVILTSAAAGAAQAQTADDLFDSNTIQEIRLSVNSRDLRALRQRYLDNTYYAADLTWRNIKLRNVAIRSRGQGSRNPIKPGLRIDMSRFTNGQRLVGLSAIVLDNLWQDDALIRERLAFTMFEKLGQPAPRESFCRLFINNEFQGLYTITEEIDAAFARRVTGETGGTLFEYHYVREWLGDDLGELAAYKPLFEPRTRVLEADRTLYGPIQDAFREINGPDDAVWRDRVGEFLDLDQFMVHVAIEAFIAENDGILGFAGMNNFYFYRSAGNTKHRLFVWDKDNAFLAIDSPVPVTSANVIFQRAMAYPDLRERYLSTLEECARLAREDGFLALEIDRLATLIADTAHQDARKQFDNDQFDLAVEFLREFAVRRPAQVLDEVARIRRGASLER